MILKPIENYQEWAKIYTDLKLWEPIVKEIFEAEKLAFNAIKETYPGSSAVFILDLKYVIKIYPPFLLNDYQVEVKMLEMLEDKILLPRLYKKGFYQRNWPYLIMQYIEGQAIREVKDNITKSNLLSIYRELGSMIKKVHQLPIDQFTTTDKEYINFINRRKETSTNEINRFKSFEFQVIKEIENAITNFVPSYKKCVIIHGDLTKDHLFLKTSDNNFVITSLIDFADSFVAEVEFEWVALFFELLDEDREGFKEILISYDDGLELNQTFLNRLLIFTFLHPYGFDMIKNKLENLGNPQIKSLTNLQELLFSKQ